MIPGLLLFAALSHIPADVPWTDWFASRGVKVEIGRVTGQPPWIRGTAEIPVPAERVAAVLMDFPRYKEFFAPAVKEARILDAADSSARLHFLWPYPFPLRNRDAVVAYRGEKSDAGAFVLSWKADPRPGDPKEGVRIERVVGETRVEPLGPSRCRVIYTYLGDLGGNFPARAEEKAWKEEPVQYIRAIRRRLGISDPAE